MKKYKKSELEVHEYGHGRQKLFIIYTDYKETSNGPWHTRVYPDIRGNKGEAIKEALNWLNDTPTGEPWIVRDKPSKIFIVYHFGE